MAYVVIESIYSRVEELADRAGVNLQDIFMSNATYKQLTIASYGSANVQRLRAIQKTCDPGDVRPELGVPETCSRW